MKAWFANRRNRAKKRILKTNPEIAAVINGKPPQATNHLEQRGKGVEEFEDAHSLKLDNSYQSVFKLNTMSSSSGSVGLELGEVMSDEYKIMNDELINETKLQLHNNEYTNSNVNGSNIPVPAKKMRLPSNKARKTEILAPMLSLPDDLGHEETANILSNQIKQFNQVFRVEVFLFCLI